MSNFSSSATLPEGLRTGQNRILEMIARGAPTEDTLRRLIELIESESDGMLGSILFLDPDGIHVRQGVAPNLPPDYYNAFDGIAIGPNEGSCGTAMYRRKQIIVADIQSDPLWAKYRDFAGRFGLRACWSTPILSSQGQVLGAFAMYYTDVRNPGERELQIIEVAVHLAGIAIERLRSEEAVRTSDDRYRRFFEHDLSAAYITQPDGTILACNPAFCRLFGFENPDAAMGENIAMLHTDPSRRAALLERLHQERQVQDLEIELQRLDGKNVHAQTTVVGCYDSTGNLQEINGYLIDQTERHNLETQLRQSQKMEAIGQLAGGVAHDFNNLLTSIIGYSEVLLAEENLAPDAREAATEIRTAGTRAATLTRQLLAFSRRQILKPADIDLNVLIAELEKMLRRLIGEDIEFSIRHAENLGLIRADASQIEQVIINLVINARDAMPNGGQLTISTSNVTLSEKLSGDFTDLEPGNYVDVIVQDTGTGIPDDIRAHIFEPFFTTKGPGRGTGLGLSTVYGIVEQSSGAIAVNSTPNSGSTFRILFPRIEKSLPAQTESARKDRKARGSETILLVEDNDLVQKVTSKILKQAGYNVLEARNGVEALKRQAEHPESIDLLLTDVVMPGKNGREVADELSALNPKLRIIFMSGYTDDTVIRRGGLKTGFTLLEKPFMPDTLLGKIREILDQPA